MDQRDVASLLDDPVLTRLRDVLAERPDAIITVSDADGRTWWGSRPGSRHLFHRLPEEYRGLCQLDYVHPDDEAHVRRMFAMALQGETAQFTFRASTAEGEWRRVTSVCWAIETPRHHDGDDHRPCHGGRGTAARPGCPTRRHRAVAHVPRGQDASGSTTPAARTCVIGTGSGSAS